jgi:hypothetical protein
MKRKEETKIRFQTIDNYEVMNSEENWIDKSTIAIIETLRNSFLKCENYIVIVNRYNYSSENNCNLANIKITNNSRGKNGEYAYRWYDQDLSHPKY